LVRDAWEKLAKRASKLADNDLEGPDEQWHDARIKAKQARYAAEAVTSVLGKPAARLAVAAKSVQEVLGNHQDAAVAAETLNDLGHQHLEDGELCLVAGRLVQANRCAVADSRREFGPAWDVARKAVG
jgi:CHAD domain-containing protein